MQYLNSCSIYLIIEINYYFHNLINVFDIKCINIIFRSIYLKFIILKTDIKGFFICDFRSCTVFPNKSKFFDF